MCIAAPGCGARNGEIKVLVKNESNLELRSIRIELVSTIRTLDTLRPKESATIAFPVPTGEASFAVSAEGPSGKSVKKTVGYVDHSIRKSVITFKSSPDGSEIEVDAESQL
jgi:hypothetical protein